MKDRIIATLELFIKDWQWRHDQTGVPGNYSPELKEAMRLLEDVKNSKCDMDFTRCIPANGNAW
jgi:hypothetical protein